MHDALSVVTTIYNGERYLERGVSSILAQTNVDFEYVIVDDGSTDGTLGALRSLAEVDRRIRVLAPGRLGFARALNHAVGAARGAFIAIQDVDDLSYAGRLWRQAAFLQRHADVGVVGGYYRLVDDSRRETYVRMPPIRHEEIVRAMPLRIPLAHTLVMFRKQAWAEAGGYPEVDDVEDFLLWVRIAARGWRLANIPRVLGEHWVHAGSFWHRAYAYGTRNRKLRSAQREAIRSLGLPRWMHVYPAARGLYRAAPVPLKRFLRRWLGRSRERDDPRDGAPARATFRAPVPPGGGLSPEPPGPAEAAGGPQARRRYQPPVIEDLGDVIGRHGAMRDERPSVR